jgi:hypothetical protein
VLGLAAAALELHQAPHWSLDPATDPVARILDAHHPGRSTHFHAVLGSDELRCLRCLSSLRDGSRLLCRVTGTVRPSGRILLANDDSQNVVQVRTRTVEARGPPRV